jgi:TP901 family phage tail tape measure protein
MDGQARINVILELKNKVKTGMSQAKQYINKNVNEIKDRIGSLKESTVQAFSSMADSVPGFGNVIGMLKNPLVIVTAAVVALAGAYSKASAMAGDFERSMLKANVTAQESKPELAATSSRVLDIAGNSTIKNAATSAPDAYNILLSAGMEKETALATLNPTLQAAKAGYADIAVVARAAAASMNSSGIKDANRIYDILFATLNKGNAEFADIANYLPKIIPVAKNVGINMEQVAGAFAYLTAQGQTSERSATLLENAFKVLADPDKVKKFEKIGVSIYDQQGQVKPLVSIVDQLNLALNGLSDEKRTKVLDSLGLDSEAASAFSAMSQDAGKFKEIIDATINSQGQLNKAIESSSSPMDNWVKMGNKVDVMWIKVGGHVNETLGRLGEEILPYVESGLGIVEDTLTGIWDVIDNVGSAIWNAIKPQVEFLKNSGLINDMWWLIKGTLQTLWDFTLTVGSAINDIYQNTLKPIFEGVTEAYKSIKAIAGDFKQGFDDIKSVFTGKTIDSYKEKYAAGKVSWNDIVKEFGLESANQNFPEIASQKKAYDDNYKSFISGLKPATNLLAGNGTDTKTNRNLLTLDKDKKKDGGGITGGQQTRIININKLSVVDGNFISQSPELASMGKKEIERFLEELLQRAMQGLVRSAT